MFTGTQTPTVTPKRTICLHLLRKKDKRPVCSFLQSLGENKTLNQQNHWETLGCTRSQNKCMLVFIDGVHLRPYLRGLSALTGWCRALSEGGVAPRLPTWQRVSIQRLGRVSWSQGLSSALLIDAIEFLFGLLGCFSACGCLFTWFFSSRLRFYFTLCVSVPSRAVLGPHLCLVFSVVSSALCQNFSLFRWSCACFPLCVIFCFLWYFVGGYLSSSRLHTPLCDITVEAQRVWGLLLICWNRSQRSKSEKIFIRRW